ncbi:MAG: Crp/Fnr family transcriptional regulator [Campylobacter sp.]|nr:Crp/Fnr family transcriptional regulator [Campylobacter sp.]
MLNNTDSAVLREKFKNFEISDEDIKMLSEKSMAYKFNKGQILYRSKNECFGFMLVKSGVLRAYFLAENAKEITIFNLTKGDDCLLCSNCMSENLLLNINMEVKEDLEIIVIPPNIFNSLKQKYPLFTNYILTLISKRFSDSISIMQEAIFLPLTERLKKYLKDNAIKNYCTATHEEISNELGTSREAISRILKEMEKEGFIKLSRGKIYIKS